MKTTTEKDLKMTRLKFVILTLIGFALGLAGDIEENKISSTPGSTKTFEVTISKAYAGGRLKRRNTTVPVRRTILPYRCVWRAPYHYCLGVYYKEIVEFGATVYIVVYP